MLLSMVGKVLWPPCIVDEKNAREIVPTRACHADERRIRTITLADGTAESGLNGRPVTMAAPRKLIPGITKHNPCQNEFFQLFNDLRSSSEAVRGTAALP
jgi:hypothetical protein